MAASDFLLNTDYPLDKVIWMDSGSVTIPAYDTYGLYINHGLPFTPLAKGRWTTDSTWGVSYEMNGGPIDTSPTAPHAYTYATSISSTSTQVIFGAKSYKSTSTTIYYRLWALMPSTVNDEVAHTSSTLNNFIINTDVNYSKLYLSGVTSYTTTVSNVQTINHNLGYRPQVMAWSEQRGVVYDKTFSSIFSGVLQNGAVNVGTNTVDFIAPDFLGGIPIRYHYRIYIDGQT